MTIALSAEITKNHTEFPFDRYICCTCTYSGHQSIRRATVVGFQTVLSILSGSKIMLLPVVNASA